MLKTILSVSGKSGLYKMISQGKNMLVIESLADKKRIPAYVKDKVISLGDITIYSTAEEIPLYKVFNAIKAKENGRKVAFDLSKATPDELRAYLGEVAPDFDRGRVYPTDIKRILSWYNYLLSVDITEFDPQQEEAEKTDSEEPEAGADSKKTAKTPKTATVKNAAVPKKNVTAAKPAVSKTTQRTRQK